MKKQNLICIIVIAVIVTVATIFGVIMYTKSQTTDDIEAYYNQKCSTFAEENLDCLKGQIVFLGDSITDGYPLKDHYLDLPLEVYNRGIGGDSTGGVIKRLEVSVFDIAPSKIILLIGINDINGGVSTETLLKNYDKILSLIKEELPDTKVFCISILPMNKDVESYTTINVDKSHEKIGNINQSIANLAIKYGYKFVDIHDDFTDENGYLSKNLSIDGIHLSSDGYALWTEKAKPILKEND
jgi:lysophospholipase L1-like esterase